MVNLNLEPRMAMDPFTGEPSDDQHPDHTVLAGMFERSPMIPRIYDETHFPPQEKLL